MQGKVGEPAASKIEQTEILNNKSIRLYLLKAGQRFQGSGNLRFLDQAVHLRSWCWQRPLVLADFHLMPLERHFFERYRYRWPVLA